MSEIHNYILLPDSDCMSLSVTGLSVRAFCRSVHPVQPQQTSVCCYVVVAAAAAAAAAIVAGH